MASVSRVRAVATMLAPAMLTSAALACSPEADRTRDGGRGADPRNWSAVVRAAPAEPRAADTTLIPGRAPAVVDRLAAGTMAPPPGVTFARTDSVGGSPQSASAAESEQDAFDRGTGANPRRSGDSAVRRPEDRP